MDNDDILDEYVMDETNHMNDHEIFKDDEACLQNMPKGMIWSPCKLFKNKRKEEEESTIHEKEDELDGLHTMDKVFCQQI